MPKYKVQITKYIEHFDTVEVEAINDMEAKELLELGLFRKKGMVKKD